MTKSSKSFADSLWDDLHNQTIDIFSLPNQKLQQHVERLDLDPDTLCLKPKSPSVILSVEKLIGDKFKLSMSNNGYILLTK